MSDLCRNLGNSKGFTTSIDPVSLHFINMVLEQTLYIVCLLSCLLLISISHVFKFCRVILLTTLIFITESLGLELVHMTLKLETRTHTLWRWWNRHDGIREVAMGHRAPLSVTTPQPGTMEWPTSTNITSPLTYLFYDREERGEGGLVKESKRERLSNSNICPEQACTFLVTFLKFPCFPEILVGLLPIYSGNPPIWISGKFLEFCNPRP